MRWAAMFGLALGLGVGTACGGGGAGSDNGDGGPFVDVADVPAAGFVHAVWVFAPDDVWLAADAGQMLHFDGAQWETYDLGAGQTMLDLWGFSPDQLWAVGDRTLAVWDGQSWTQSAFADLGVSGVSISRIWANAPDDVWISGDQSTVAHFDGSTWTRSLAAGSDNVALWGAASDAVYTGSVFEIARFDGATWTPLELDQLNGASAIYGFGPDDVWIADDADLAHFDGVSWSFDELEGLGDVTQMWGPRSDELWSVGEFGSIHRFDGSVWSELQSQPIGAPYLQSFLDVHGTADGEVWVVGVLLGQGGATPQVLRYAP